MKTRQPKRGLLLVLGFYAGLLLLWQGLGFFREALHLPPNYLFPTPWDVVHRLVELHRDGVLFPSIKTTLMRMGVGFCLSAAIGLCIGLAMGTNWAINRTLKSLFLGLQTLPTAAWVPISFMLFGWTDTGIYFVIIMSSTSAMAIATSDGILNIPPIYLRAARTLGTGPVALYWRVIIPAALPNIVTGLKLGWTLGWHGAVSAELIKNMIGLGWLLQMGRELNDMPQVIGIMLVIIGFGLILDQFLFGVIERRIRRRWGLTAEEDLKR